MGTKGRFLFPRRSLYSRKSTERETKPNFLLPSSTAQRHTSSPIFHPKICCDRPSNTKLKLAKLLMNLAQLSSRSSAPTAGTEKHPVTTHRVAYPKDDFG